MPLTSLSQYTVQQQPPTLFDAIFDTPLPSCKIGARCNQQGITCLRFLPGQAAAHAPPPEHPQHTMLEQLNTQLLDYLNKPGVLFSLPLAATGTAFQHRVWHVIAAIPYGETRSYGQLAQQLGSSARAIGGACRANPLPLLVPCHRVIAADGRNGGFLGQTAANKSAASIKQWLLHHEARSIPGYAPQH